MIEILRDIDSFAFEEEFVALDAYQLMLHQTHSIPCYPNWTALESGTMQPFKVNLILIIHCKLIFMIAVLLLQANELERALCWHYRVLDVKSLGRGSVVNLQAAMAKTHLTNKQHVVFFESALCAKSRWVGKLGENACCTD